MAVPAEESACESSSQIPDMLAILERRQTSRATWAGQGLTRSQCRGSRRELSISLLAQLCAF